MPHQKPAILVNAGLGLLVAVVSLIVTASPVLAQDAGVIHGRVVNADGEGIAGAQVLALGEAADVERGVTADADGTYRLSGLPAGVYRLRVEAIGYRPAERADVRVRAGDDLTIGFTLQTSPVAISEVVVSATRSAAQVSALPAAVTVIEREQIAEQASVSPAMGEVLTQLVPGLSAGTQSMSTYGQSFRGRSATVLIDGVPQSTGRNAFRDFTTIDPAMVERVEVVRGATSIYGDGATGGVINIQTRLPAAGGDRFTTAVGAESSLSAPGDGTGYRVLQSASGRRGPIDFVVSGSLLRTGGRFDARGDRIPPDPHGQGGLANVDSHDLFGKFGSTFGDQRVQLSVNHYRSEQDTRFTTDPAVNQFEPSSRKARSRAGLDLAENQAARNTFVNLDYRNGRLLGSGVRAQVFYRDYLTRFFPFDGRAFASLGNAIIQSHIDSRTLGGRLNIETPLGSGAAPSLVWGVDYTAEESSQPVSVMDPEAYDESGGLVFAKIGERPWVPPVDARKLGLFAQSAWDPLPRWSLHAGVRHERADVQVDDFTTIVGDDVEGGELDFTPVLFNAGVLFTASDALHLFGRFSQGFSLADIGRVLRAAPPGFALGSRSLDAQKVDNYELGVRGLGSRVQATLSGYYNESDLGTSFDADLNTVRAPERIYGVEATLDAQPLDALGVGGTLTWTEGENYIEAEDEWRALNGYRIQPMKITAHAEHETLPGWSNRLQMLYSGHRDAAAEDGVGFGGAPVDAYTIVDLISRLQLGPGTLDLTLENLFNEQYFPIMSQLEGSLANSRRAAARGTTLSVGYSVSY